MREFITDRTQADVDRCKELHAKGWNNMTEAEKTEWYGTAKRGAYNYSDLNRVESAVAELSSFLKLGLTTKTDWGMWDVPTQADMSRYISNLQTVKERCLSNVAIPVSMNSLTRESANNIEKMLSKAYENKDTHNVWQKSTATVKYVREYTRVYDHPQIGTTGVYHAVSWRNGELYASPTVDFTTRGGFDTGLTYYPASSVVGMYATVDAFNCVMARITSEPYFSGHTQEYVMGGQTRIGYSYEMEYEVVGYATYETVPDCSVGSSLGCVLIPQGTMPEGTLIKGSLKDGYCYVHDPNGNYYYYELC